MATFSGRADARQPPTASKHNDDTLAAAAAPLPSQLAGLAPVGRGVAVLMHQRSNHQSAASAMINTSTGTNSGIGLRRKVRSGVTRPRIY